MKSQVEDLKTTLKINKDLFFKNINQDKNNEDTLLSQMRAENARISRKIDEMFEEKTLIEKKLYKLQQAFEDRMNSDREIIEKLNEKIFIYENKLVEKKDSMNIMKGLINRQIINEMSQKFRYVYVVDPTKSNIDLNNELNYTRDILAKISKLINSEKIKNDTMENQIKNLQQELNLYRKNNKVYDCVTKEIKLGKENL